MLSVRMQNVAVVVLSVSNNPRLLNADFLKRHQIVPDDWNAVNVLVTPPFAQVTFENGLQILVEESKLSFLSTRPDTFPWAEELSRIAIAYLALLPHVTYGAVGLNFTFISDDLRGEAAEKALIRKLLLRGPWLNVEGGITGAVLELQYHKGRPQMNVKIGVLETGGPAGRTLEGFIFNVNFHDEFQADQRDERAEYIGAIARRQEDFTHFLEKLPF